MKIVLDTNVVLAAFITQGVTNKIFERILFDHYLIISPYILDELERKLSKKFKVPIKQRKDFVEFLRRYLAIVNPKGKEPKECRDNKDNQILLLAQYVKADCVITGDKDLLVIKKHKKTKIYSPREFFDKYRER